MKHQTTNGENNMRKIKIRTKRFKNFNRKEIQKGNFSQAAVKSFAGTGEKWTGAAYYTGDDSEVKETPKVYSHMNR